MRKLELKELYNHQGFSLLGHTVSDKNKLYTDVRKLLLSKSNKLLTEPGELIELADQVIDGIAMLNVKHSKCKPIEACFEYSYNADSILLRGTHCHYEIHFAGDYDRPEFND